MMPPSTPATTATVVTDFLDADDDVASPLTVPHSSISLDSGTPSQHEGVAQEQTHGPSDAAAGLLRDADVTRGFIDTSTLTTAALGVGACSASGDGCGDADGCGAADRPAGDCDGGAVAASGARDGDGSALGRGSGDGSGPVLTVAGDGDGSGGEPSTTRMLRSKRRSGLVGLH
jgi:hypothetical protein